MAAEALECLGGNGYVEESGMPRIYRDAPLNSVWEGSGNVTALDVLRALARSPESGAALLAEADLAAGGDRRLDQAILQLRKALGETGGRAGRDAEYRARSLAGLIAVVLQGALLVRHAPAEVADAFCASRLDPGTGGPAGPGLPFGMLPDGLRLTAVLSRSHAAAAG